MSSTKLLAALCAVGLAMLPGCSCGSLTLNGSDGGGGSDGGNTGSDGGHCGPDEFLGADQLCHGVTVCGASQCETVAPTPTSDRQCGPLTLVVTPAAPSAITVAMGAQTPTVAFTATACGAPISAAWTVDVGAIGTVASGTSPTNTFTPSGQQGGMVHIIAGAFNQVVKVPLFVQLTAGQNGINPNAPSEQQQIPANVGALVQGGGVGGVGGEGLGPALAAADPNLVALQGQPAGDGSAQGLKLLYPYDKTVWPRGLLAPLLQWTWQPGDADAIRIDLRTSSGSFAWTGTFGRPAILSSLPSGHFVRHPIPQDVWDAATNTAGATTTAGASEGLVLKLTVAKGGVAYGPIVQSWVVAPARLSGTIYYQSYGTNLANNTTGALGNPTNFGAAVLSIRVGDTGPKLVSSASTCQVCHSVASRGGRLVTQQATNNDGDSLQYTLLASGNSSTLLARGMPFPGYPGLFPDGTMMLTPQGKLQPLPDDSTDLPISGLSAVTSNVGVPAFSPDGKKVVFNPQDTVTHPARELVVMDFDKASGAFSNPAVVVDDAISSPANADIRSSWPAFFPTGDSVVYQHLLRVSADGHSADEHSRKFTQGQLHWASATSSAAPVALDALNGQSAGGASYLPVLATGVNLSCTADSLPVGANAGADGDITHALDSRYNYEPTVNPVSSGGYAWVVFTSRRLYGNVATIPPFCSDPRGVDLHADMISNTNITTKKLWVAAIDLKAAPGTDPSHPAFYLPAQELLAGNARGFWVLDPCRAEGASCLTGDQCCDGYCQPGSDGGTSLVCTTKNPNTTCSHQQEACNTAADCCDANALCAGGFCAVIN